MEQYYLVIEKEGFGFASSESNKIRDEYIPITTEDYLIWKEEKNNKSFRLKENTTGNGLFDYIEEYIPVVEEIPYTPTLAEINRADIDYIAIMTGVEL